MTFTQQAATCPPTSTRAMRGSLIFFERLAEHLSGELKARHDSD